MKSPVKILLTLLTVFALTPIMKAQNYEKEWKTIDSLEQKGLPESAMKEADKLYEKIKKNAVGNAKQLPQLMKALIYVNKYQSQMEEEGLVKSIYRFQTEMETAQMPAKAILQSMVAEAYDQYLLNHLYKFQDRTSVGDYKLEDIRTWDVKRIAERSYDLYWASIQDPSLKTIPVGDLSGLVNSANSYGEGLHPTMYDFLLNRALGYFMGERTYITQPAFRFYIDQPEAFSDASTFAQYNFKTRDSLSMPWQTLRLMQEATRFHLNDKDPQALLDLELRRLNYVWGKSILGDKDERYLAALQTLENKYSSSPACAEVGYYIASYYYGKASFSTLQDESRWYRKKSMELCDKTISKHPNSYGAINCAALKTSILAKSLAMETERVFGINENILAKVTYGNINKLHLKTVRLTDVERRKMANKYGEELANYLASLPAVNSWSIKLPDEGDYQIHSTEIAIPAIKQAGSYAVVASENDRFSYSKNGMVIAYLNISNLAYLSKQVDGIYEYYVVNRGTGAPIQGVKVEFFTQRYNSLLRRYENRKIGEGLTDDKGYVKTPDKAARGDYGYTYIHIKLSKGDDILDNDNNFYNYSYETEPVEHDATYFFTDRAIYRPGQTVYFKGLVLHNPGTKTPKIVPNYSTTIVFRDANYQEVARLDLVSNEYGSFQGSFTAPVGGLTGQMSMYDATNGAEHFFRVEEYKRPKFEVTANPLEGSFKIGDKVITKGIAKAFAGNAIDDAKVQYRVVRAVEFPYWGWWYWGWGWRNPYRREQQEIVSGEARTNDKGEYEITFEAIADKTIPANTKPLFTYIVYVDVTDNTGETHSTESRVRVGYIALDADIEVPTTVTTDKDGKWKIHTRNLNGDFEAAKGNIKVELLETSAQVFNQRYWELPDYKQLTEAEFKSLFPYYAAGNEDQIGNLKAVKTVMEAAFDTKTSKELEVKPQAWEQGQYKITLTTQDKYGEKIELVRYCSVVAAQKPKVTGNTALYVAKTNFDAQPNDKITAQFGTKQNGGYVLIELVEEGYVTRREWVSTENAVCAEREFSVTEEHRGNFYLNFSSVYHNRAYAQSATVNVPWSNKDLNIEFATFRDKLAPGQEEEWRIKISGEKKDKVLAEVLAGMYDASLDQFAPNSWGLSPFSMNYNISENSGYDNFLASSASSISDYYWNDPANWASKSYPTLNWFNFSFYDYGYYGYYGEGDMYMAMDATESGAMPDPSPAVARASAEEKLEMPKMAKSQDDAPVNALKNGEKMPLEQQTQTTTQTKPEGKPDGDFGDVKVRTNLNETVFFFPQLNTDAEGNVIIKFKMNEALTKWKFMVLAHSKDLQSAVATRSVVTQKDLMITPNAPRFFRQNDEIFFTAKVANITKNKLDGQATLQLFDAVTMQPIDAAFGNTAAVQNFSVEGERSAGLSWRLKIPAGWTNAITHRVVAKSGTFSDGEESSLPVLTNQMLVTETMPLPIRGGQTKTFQFGRMAEASKSSTLIQHKLTLEFTPNPAWYAIQALPYMMEYPYECTEQVFSRYYSNSLASSVANAHPKIKKVFDTWRDYQPSALESNLSKNQELKYALIEETPWVLAAQSEAQQKKNIGVLFDLNRMAGELDKARDKMAERQLANGGFAWFPGGRDSWYITQYIVEGFGHLDALGVKEIKSDDKVDGMVRRAVNYTDDELANYYTELLKWLKRNTKSDKEFEEELAKDHLDYMAIHYLYARSFFGDQEINNATTKKAIEYYEGQADKYWLSKSDYMQGMLALSFHRKQSHKNTVDDIVKSLKERALKNEEMGMYWKYPSGYFWYELPIETHALMIEVFDEVAQDPQAVDDLKTWLLKAKQTTHWQTTKATAAACYALLRRGDNWLLEDKDPVITLGKEMVDLTKVQKEAGSGHFKTDWAANQIKPEMATVTVQNPNKNVAWGAIYWQYFENLDKITFFKDTPLKINKKLFKVINTDKGQVLKPIENEQLVPGDLVKVRIEIFVDRDMEYVHMKDMRAAGFDPVNVLSQYKYQGGLGYYESTKDMATHFFIDYLSKGTYVFEYPLRATHKGDFSNGITTIQCMYAPEFTSHSEGVRVKIK